MEKSYFLMHFNHDVHLLTDPVAYASNEWAAEPQQMGPGFHFMVDSERLHDYLMNNSNLPLMSERMKSLFSGVNGAEKTTWFKVDVLDRNARAWPYYIPYFKKAPRVLNRRKSEMVDDILVRAVFDAAKVGELEFFPVGPGAEIRLVVSGRMKEVLEKAGLTGLAFAPVEVV